jgi:tetratricopeptide (TPR) repeat protein
MNLDRALEVAQNDYAAQKDIYASDTLAWCLYKKGLLQEAKVLIGEAMRIKTNDARILFHAGMIDSSLGNRKAAASLIKTALKLNPQFDLLQAESARTELMRLSDVS